jgi:hypothetical protein
MLPEIQSLTECGLMSEIFKYQTERSNFYADFHEIVNYFRKRQDLFISSEDQWLVKVLLQITSAMYNDRFINLPPPSTEFTIQRPIISFSRNISLNEPYIRIPVYRSDAIKPFDNRTFEDNYNDRIKSFMQQIAFRITAPSEVIDTDLGRCSLPISLKKDGYLGITKEELESIQKDKATNEQNETVSSKDSAKLTEAVDKDCNPQKLIPDPEKLEPDPGESEYHGLKFKPTDILDVDRPRD